MSDVHSSQAAEIFRRAEPGLLRLATLLSGDANRAQDLVQDTFVRAWPHHRRLVRMDSPVAYLRRILIRECRRTRPAFRHRRDFFVGGQEADVADGVVGRDWANSLLWTLPAGQRRVLVLRFYCDMSEAETAAVLDCSAGNVKSQASRGLQSLRTQLVSRTTTDSSDTTRSANE